MAMTAPAALSTEGAQKSSSRIEGPGGLDEPRGAPQVVRSAYLFLSSLLLSALTIGLWSSMGMGQVAIDALQTHDWLWYPCTASWSVILAVLLALDFFRPPHLPGEYMRLWEGDVLVGRGLFALGALCFWGSLLFMAGNYPSVPLVTTIMLGPVLMALVRWRLSKKVSGETVTENFSKSSRALKELATLEAQSGHFYCAAALAFLAAALASLAAWLIWVTHEGREFGELAKRDCVDGWLAPLECAPIFSYQGSAFAHCTTAGGVDIPWCSHTERFGGAWSNCQKCEETEVDVYAGLNGTAWSCTWGGAATLSYRGSPNVTQEQCTAYCSLEAQCQFAIHYPGEGVGSSLCGLASSCSSLVQGAIQGAVVPSNATLYQRAKETVLSSRAKDELILLWSAPLVVSISNFVFALFAMARVLIHKTYTLTADFQVEDTPGIERTPSDTARQTVSQQNALRQLAIVVKLVVCAFIFMITMFWIAGQLLYADSRVAQMVLGLMGAFFLTFICFTALSMKRVVRHLWSMVAQLPMWRTAQAIAQSDWTRAFLFCVALPVIPLVYACSRFCQSVRNARGLYDHENLKKKPCVDQDSDYSAEDSEGSSPKAWKKSRELQELGPSERDLKLTPRVHRLFEGARNANRLSLVGKCYFFCTLMFLYTVFPVAFNVLLAWTNQALLKLGLDFGVMVAIIFLLGVIAFLLPPVPGLTVYVFGGIMMSVSCPDGFWVGAVTNIFVGWGLKLVACAIQQKIIGGLLGHSLWVRRTCGVHKTTIRCIEAELRRPGWSIGKLAILCGGPDWPTSVLAGILNLSLVQCELGTLPIIFFIIPCSLSGSFYMMRGVSEVWTRSANLMLAASVLISGVLWVIAAWAIQNQLESNYEELTRPLAKNIDLEWLDYKDAELRRAADVSWATVPAPVRLLYGACAILQILVCHAFYFGFEYLFNSFEVSDSISELKSWYGEEGIVLSSGLAAIVVFCMAWAGPIVFACWSRTATRAARRKAAAKLDDSTEAAWKENRLIEIQNWKPEEPRKEPESPMRKPSSLRAPNPHVTQGSSQPGVNVPEQRFELEEAEAEATPEPGRPRKLSAREKVAGGGRRGGAGEVSPLSGGDFVFSTHVVQV